MGLIQLKHEEYEGCNLLETFRNAAKADGYSVCADTEYDCTKICVAGNIQDAWYEYYTKQIKQKYATVPEQQIKTEITMMLAICGAKVDRELSDGEAMVLQGFASCDGRRKESGIGEKNGKDIAGKP